MDRVIVTFEAAVAVVEELTVALAVPVEVDVGSAPLMSSNWML